MVFVFVFVFAVVFPIRFNWKAIFTSFQKKYGLGGLEQVEVGRRRRAKWLEKKEKEKQKIGRCPVGPTITIAKTLNPETAVPLTIFNCFVSFSLIYMSYIEHHNLMGHGTKTYISHTTVQSENILNTIMQFDYHLQAAESRVFNSWFTSGKISN